MDKNLSEGVAKDYVDTGKEAFKTVETVIKEPIEATINIAKRTKDLALDTLRLAYTPVQAIINTTKQGVRLTTQAGATVLKSPLHLGRIAVKALGVAAAPIIYPIKKISNKIKNNADKPNRYEATVDTIKGKTDKNVAKVLDFPGQKLKVAPDSKESEAKEAA